MLLLFYATALEFEFKAEYIPYINSITYSMYWKYIVCAHSALHIWCITCPIALQGVKYHCVSQTMRTAIQVVFYSTEVKSKGEETVCTCVKVVVEN